MSNSQTYHQTEPIQTVIHAGWFSLHIFSIISPLFNLHDFSYLLIVLSFSLNNTGLIPLNLS